MGLFNANWKPGATDYYSAGGTPEDYGRQYNAAGAFSGIEGLRGAQTSGDGNYFMAKYQGDDRYTANVKPQDGKVGDIAWKYNPVTSDADMLMQGAALAAAAYGGLSAGGFLGGAGAGSGAGFVGEGVGSGVPAWDGAMGGSMLEAGGAASGGGSLFGSAGELLGKIPTKVWGSLGSGLLSSAGGGSGGGYSGPMPTITRGGWKPQVTPQYMSLFDVGSLVKGKP